MSVWQVFLGLAFMDRSYEDNNILRCLIEPPYEKMIYIKFVIVIPTTFADIRTVLLFFLFPPSHLKQDCRRDPLGCFVGTWSRRRHASMEKRVWKVFGQQYHRLP